MALSLFVLLRQLVNNMGAELDVFVLWITLGFWLAWLSLAVDVNGMS